MASLTLSGPTMKALLSLNSLLSPEDMEVWITVEEMRERLVICGVHQTLTVDILEYALTRVNRGEIFMTRRREGDTSFFRPSTYAHMRGAPRDRESRGPFSPSRDCLKSNPNAREKLGTVNDALMQLARDAAKEKEKAGVDGGGEDDRNENETSRAPAPTLNDDVGGGREDSGGDSASSDDDGDGSPTTQQQQILASERGDGDDSNAGGRQGENAESQDDDEASFGGGGDTATFDDSDSAVVGTPPRRAIASEGGDINCMDSSLVKDNEGYGIFNIPLLVKFIRKATAHAAICGAPLDLEKMDKRYGAGITQTWQCPNCLHTLQFNNCTWVKSPVVEPGRKYSRPQPEINLKIAAGARYNGVNLNKLTGLMEGSFGIKIYNTRNAKHIDRKIRVGVSQLFDMRQEENRRTHVAACREMGCETLDWEHNGDACVATLGRLAQDGVGKKRAYGQKINGDESGLVQMSLDVGLPLTLEHSQNKCIRCTLAFNRNVRKKWAKGEEVTVEDIANISMEHDGPCHRKNTYHIAASEEPESRRAAEQLLFDKTGTPRGADTCVAIETMVADLDTRGPKAAIQRQNQILGSVSDNKADHVPDLGHTVKLNNNDFFKIREKDPSFRGVNCLSNVRIKSIQSDITAAVKAYHPHVGNPAERTKCLKQLKAIVRHHCGDHSCCTEEKFCTYTAVKKENPTWSPEKVAEEAMKRSKRQRKEMDLSKYGIEVLERIIQKRFNEKSIDKIAACGSSNICEGFWSLLVKLSEGKRIQGCGTDLWLTMLRLCYCQYGGDNAEKSREQLSELLGVIFTDVEKSACKRSKRKRESDKKRHSGEEGKKRRKFAKICADHLMGKNSDKKAQYKSGKVPTTESAKSKVVRCTKCGEEGGHKTRQCVQIKAPKRQKTKVFAWKGKVLSRAKHQPRLKSNQPVMYDWSKSSLLANAKK